MSKYIIGKNLEIFEHKIQSIRNENIKMDYEKIFKHLKQKSLKIKSQLKLFNYIIEKHIYQINILRL